MKTNDKFGSYKALSEEIAETTLRLDNMRKKYERLRREILDCEEFSFEGQFFKKKGECAVCVGQNGPDAIILAIREGFDKDGEYRRYLVQYGINIAKLAQEFDPCTPDEFACIYRSTIKEFDVLLEHAIEKHKEDIETQAGVRKPVKRALVDPSAVSIHPTK